MTLSSYINLAFLCTAVLGRMDRHPRDILIIRKNRLVSFFKVSDISFSDYLSLTIGWYLEQVLKSYCEQISEPRYSLEFHQLIRGLWEGCSRCRVRIWPKLFFPVFSFGTLYCSTSIKECWVGEMVTLSIRSLSNFGRHCRYDNLLGLLRKLGADLCLGLDYLPIQSRLRTYLD